MRSLPRRRRSSGGSARASRPQAAAGFGGGRDSNAARDGSSDARRFDLWPWANCFQRSRIRLESMEFILMSEASAPSPLIPVPRGPLPEAPPAHARRQIEISIDGKAVSVPEGATILDAARSLGIDTPTLCYLDTLTPVNVCRVCVVELDGSRTLVPACSRKAEPGMVIQTDSERVRLSRRIVIEFLASSVDASTAPTL